MVDTDASVSPVIAASSTRLSGSAVRIASRTVSRAPARRGRPGRAGASDIGVPGVADFIHLLKIMNRPASLKRAVAAPEGSAPR